VSSASLMPSYPRVKTRYTVPAVSIGPRDGHLPDHLWVAGLSDLNDLGRNWCCREEWLTTTYSMDSSLSNGDVESDPSSCFSTTCYLRKTSKLTLVITPH